MEELRREEEDRKAEKDAKSREELEKFEREEEDRKAEKDAKARKELEKFEREEDRKAEKSSSFSDRAFKTALTATSTTDADKAYRVEEELNQENIR